MPIVVDIGTCAILSLTNKEREEKIQLILNEFSKIDWESVHSSLDVNKRYRGCELSCMYLVAFCGLTNMSLQRIYPQLTIKNFKNKKLSSNVVPNQTNPDDKSYMIFVNQLSINEETIFHIPIENPSVPQKYHDKMFYCFKINDKREYEYQQTLLNDFKKMQKLNEEKEKEKERYRLEVLQLFESIKKRQFVVNVNTTIEYILDILDKLPIDYEVLQTKLDELDKLEESDLLNQLEDTNDTIRITSIITKVREYAVMQIMKNK